MYTLASLKRNQRQLDRRQPGRQQQGAALIVALIMLLLLTLIGVAGMRDTLLQEKMAANMRDRDVALQAAETALREAEAALSGTTPVFTNTSGMYDLGVPAGLAATKRVKPILTGSIVAEQAFWQQSWPWDATRSIVYPRTLPNLTAAQNPRYVIEKLPLSLTDLTKYPNSAFAAGSGNVAAIDESEIDESGVVNKPDFRITARAQGLTAETVVILQSTFRRATP